MSNPRADRYRLKTLPNFSPRARARHRERAGLWSGTAAVPKARPLMVTHPVRQDQTIRLRYADLVGWIRREAEVRAAVRAGLALAVTLLAWASSASEAVAQCNSDFDTNGVVDFSDFLVLSGCVGTSPAGDCDPADINGDGWIDSCDLSVLRCSYGGPNNTECCASVRCGACDHDAVCTFTGLRECVDRGGTYRDCQECRSEDTLPAACTNAAVCPCNGDLDLSGGVDDYDLMIISDCMAGARSDALCTLADINCDGAIDQCDLDLQANAGGLGGDRPNLCQTTECGICVADDGTCETREAYVCTTSGGSYLGAGAVCPDVEPGPADSGPPPSDSAPSPPSDAATTDSATARSVTEFRGAGGCTCGAATDPKGPGGPAGAVWTGLAGVLWSGFRRRERRRAYKAAARGRRTADGKR